MAASSISTPLSLGPLLLRNRNIMTALTRNRSTPTNIPNDFNVEYYRQRAAGGAGLIVSEGTLIAQQGTEWPHAPGIWNDAQVEGWKRVTKVVHAEGGLIYCQIWHLGRVSHPDMPEQKQANTPVYGPSPISARGGKFRLLPGVPGYVTPTPLDDPSILIPLYKQAAVNAKAAGFDGAELHCANGYLIHQFLDNTSNLRTDQWGGSVENRCRFGLEALKALIEVWGPDRVSIKLSPCGGYNDMGMTLEDTLSTFSYFITQADAMGIGYIKIVRYIPGADPKFDGKIRGTNHDVLASYRHLVKNAKCIVNGDIKISEVEELLGLVDAVAFGTLWISHPDLQKRIVKGIPADNKINPFGLYNSLPGEEAKGYTDYPFATES